MKKYILVVLVLVILGCDGVDNLHEEYEIPGNDDCEITAEFKGINNNCISPCEVRFENNSTNATTYLWSFGDGDTSTYSDPRHVFKSGGIYNVVLTARTDDNCTQMTSRTVTTSWNTFEKKIEGDFWGEDDSIIHTEDGGYMIFTTKKKSISSRQRDFCMIKLYSDGSVEWKKYFGGLDDDYGNYMIQTFEGDFVVTGSKEAKVYLARIDINGGVIWEKDMASGGAGFGLVQTEEGGFVIICKAYGRETFIIKTNINGVKLWSKNLPNYIGNSIANTHDGGFIFTGTIKLGNGERFLIVKTDSSGNVEWEKNYTNGSWEEGFCIIQTGDGNYVAVGITEGYNTYIIKVDANGDKIWDRHLVGGLGKSVRQTEDEGFIITGYGGQENKVVLIKVKADGTESWHRYYGSDRPSYGLDVEQTTDCGFIVSGISNESNYHLYTIKTDSEGNVN